MSSISPAATGPAAQQWLTVRELSALRNIPQPTIRRWIASGLLPATKVGPRKILIAAADFDRLCRDRQPGRSAWDSPWLSGADDEAARAVADELAAALTDEQREKLSLLLNAGARPGRRLCAHGDEDRQPGEMRSHFLDPGERCTRPAPEARR